jgi:hypothetical protein
MDHATLVKIEIHREVLEMKHAQRSLYLYTQNVRPARRLLHCLHAATILTQN